MHRDRIILPLHSAATAYVVLALWGNLACASVQTYGDMDVLGTGVYIGDPRTGATLEGLAPDAVTFGAPELDHGFPFSPNGDHLGTDQIYVGSAQTNFHDGYSGFSSGPLPGPQIILLDYSALVPLGETVTSFSLGIAADDFQHQRFGQPFTASINGITNVALTSVLNSLDQTGPQVQFFTIGLAPSTLVPTNILTLSINQGGDGGDGWAVDFLTAGVETAPLSVAVPEPATFIVWGIVFACGCIGAKKCAAFTQA